MKNITEQAIEIAFEAGVYLKEGHHDGDAFEMIRDAIKEWSKGEEMTAEREDLTFPSINQEHYGVSGTIYLTDILEAIQGKHTIEAAGYDFKEVETGALFANIVDAWLFAFDHSEQIEIFINGELVAYLSTEDAQDAHRECVAAIDYASSHAVGAI